MSYKCNSLVGGEIPDSYDYEDFKEDWASARRIIGINLAHAPEHIPSLDATTDEEWEAYQRAISYLDRNDLGMGSSL